MLKKFIIAVSAVIALIFMWPITVLASISTCTRMPL